MIVKGNGLGIFIKGGMTPDIEIFAISLFTEKLGFIYNNLLAKAQSSAFKSNISVGTFHRVCGGWGFNKNQSKRILIFYIRQGKIKNRGKAGLEIINS